MTSHYDTAIAGTLADGAGCYLFAAGGRWRVYIVRGNAGRMYTGHGRDALAALDACLRETV